jgi:hypothetical protein
MRWFPTLLTGAAVITLGCAGVTISGDRPASAVSPQGGSESGVAPKLTLFQLKNAAYPTQKGPGGMVQLDDGSFVGTGTSGPGIDLKVSLRENPAFGDLDGDGVNDAAVILITDNGLGSIFYELIPVLNRDGHPVPASPFLLGDRILVNDIGILAGRIFVTLVRQGPYDAVTAPTLRVKEIYRLDGSQLVLQEQKLLGS